MNYTVTSKMGVGYSPVSSYHWGRRQIENTFFPDMTCPFSSGGNNLLSAPKRLRDDQFLNLYGFVRVVLFLEITAPRFARADDTCSKPHLVRLAPPRPPHKTAIERSKKILSAV